MMTVITETTVQPGHEAQWDDAFRRRVEAARRQPGWVDVQVLTPAGEPNKRVVVGTWRSREDWERWHQQEAFRQTREPMNQVTMSDGQPHWHQVVERASATA